MKTFIVIISTLIGGSLLAQGGSCGDPISLGTPTTTSSCTTQSNVTTGVSGCSGSGYGGGSSGHGLTFFSFCTNANADCIEFDFSNGTSSGNWTAIIYSGDCSATLGGECLGDIGTGTTFTTSSYGLAPSTCYNIRVWTGSPGTFTVCTETSPLLNDDCAGSLPIDVTPLATDNQCATPGPTTNTPTITPGMLCAGSLENTSWYTFTVLNTADVVVTIDNIVCVGGAAGYQLGFFNGSCGSLSTIGCTSGAGGSATITVSGFVAGEVITMAMDGNAGAVCDFDISATNTVLLPVDLKYFRVEQESRSRNRLVWETASEINNDKFIIESSNDLKAWEDIGEIDGQGNSSNSSQYEFTDFSPKGDLTYYRIKQVDFDGNLKHSSVVSVINKSETKTILARYDLSGRLVNESFKGFVIVIYSDGTKDKLYQVQN